MVKHSATTKTITFPTNNTHSCVLQPNNIPTGSTLGSILGCMAAKSAAKSVDPLDWYKNFPPPLYSTTHLQRVHLILARANIKACRAELILNTIIDAFK